MATTITSKGQVTIPKRVRDSLRLKPGDGVGFVVNRDGEVVVHKASASPKSRSGGRLVRKRDRFEAARGQAEIKWRTKDLMALLRGSD